MPHGELIFQHPFCLVYIWRITKEIIFAWDKVTRFTTFPRVRGGRTSFPRARNFDQKQCFSIQDEDIQGGAPITAHMTSPPAATRTDAARNPTTPAYGAPW
jgi:hypothetical protein